MRFERHPETNGFGLVLPPEPEGLEYLSFRGPRKRQPRPDHLSRHHLYWPEKLYRRNELSLMFREHRFSSVWLLRSDHDVIHRKYDGVPVPPKDVMETYLHEAALLDELEVVIRAVEMIDEAIYEGRVKRPVRAQGRREQNLELIHEKFAEARKVELISQQAANLLLPRAQVLIAA